jgi:hypothetical protein
MAMGLAGILVGCSAATKRATPPVEEQKHSFGIYLVAVTPEKPWDASSLGDLAALTLAKEPVVADGDLLNYDFAHHAMVVKRSALSRLPSPSVWHQPFVVVADGERIYLGAFGTMLSSWGTSVPTILVDFRGFTNELVIERAYPAPGFGMGPDPRSDERIRVALAGLKKLK